MRQDDPARNINRLHAEMFNRVLAPLDNGTVGINDTVGRHIIKSISENLSVMLRFSILRHMVKWLEKDIESMNEKS